MRCPLKSREMFGYPKVSTQVSMWCVTYVVRSESGSVVYTFLNLCFLDSEKHEFLHVVCKNKYCGVVRHMPVFAEVQKPAC